LVSSSTNELTLVHQAAGQSAEAASAKTDLLARYDRAMHQAARTAGFHDLRDHEYEDAVQTAREAFLHTVDRFDPSRGVSLYGYAHLRLRGAIDKELVRPRLQRRAVMVPLGDASGVSSPGGIDTVEQEEQHQILREFLGTCKATERKLLYDHYVMERSFADIARDRGVTRAAVKMRHDAVIRRARNFFGLGIVQGAAISHP
jgi:RNA polymerase sigma factor (sigma-70 family)